ncbi:hypothetical protein L7F22_053706 [Adiantum nelumboides]|nr:hypothetical protein [Adiantum nelumboides]
MEGDSNLLAEYRYCFCVAAIDSDFEFKRHIIWEHPIALWQSVLAVCVLQLLTMMVNCRGPQFESIISLCGRGCYHSPVDAGFGCTNVHGFSCALGSVCSVATHYGYHVNFAKTCKDLHSIHFRQFLDESDDTDLHFGFLRPPLPSSSSTHLRSPVDFSPLQDIPWAVAHGPGRADRVE